VPESQSQHSSTPTVAIESQECPKCRGPMMLSRITPGRLKFDVRTFECVKCEHVEKVFAPIDPIQSDVLGWLLGELRAPT
jgi:ssDNA-binding Zn-finger/Zn-ribbon topoisomerase 1